MADEDEATPGSSTQKDLVPKRGATSVIWRWFGFEESDTDQKTVLCKLCCKPIATTDSNTTNLFYHLRKKHVSEHAESLQLRGKKEPSGAQNTPP